MPVLGEVQPGDDAAVFGHGTWKCSPLRSLISAPVATLSAEATLWVTELNPGYAGLVMTLTSSTQPHPETHFTGSEFVRNIVIGMSDGLTVPIEAHPSLRATLPDDVARAIAR